MRRWKVYRNLPFSRRYSTHKPPDRYNYNPEPSFSDVPDEEVIRYPRVTAKDLAGLSEPPTGVKMLTRDFIEDSLYNPNYGYFSKEATIFSSSNEEGFDFSSIPNSREFQRVVADRYKAYSSDTLSSGSGSQVWHTPTELFKVSYNQINIVH